MTIQAKAKVKMRHERAIQAYIHWKKIHPNATTQQCYKAFDRYVDSEELEKLLNNAA